MLSIPPTVNVVFVLSDGKEHALDPSLYSDLAKIYKWFYTRKDEFNDDLSFLHSKTEPGKKSVLKITSDGKKEAILNDTKNSDSFSV